MESSNHHQFLKPSLPADDHRFQFELYTIPAASGWFSWDNIHENEKTDLNEFFDASSVTRTPRVYKEYRDFIISKYREDPSRRLTFSDVRKSLVGDVSCLLKVFLFLEKWGLINFGKLGGGVESESEGDSGRVKVEDGPPNGVRVVAVPNSLKPVQVGTVGTTTVNGVNGRSDIGFRVGEGEFKMPPLASHPDVYQEVIELVCASCKERCESGRYEHTKDECYVICAKCFKNGSYGGNKSADDYKFVDNDNGTLAASWTEAETLLLLESVLKHGDDWELVAQNVQTKSKLDCIAKLLQLPFGHLMLGSTHDRRVNNGKQGHPASQEVKDGGSQQVEIENQSQPASQESKDGGSQQVEIENQSQPAPQEIKDGGSEQVETENKSQENGDADIDEPPSKRICIAPVSYSSEPKTEQMKDKEDEQVTPSLPFNEDVSEKDGHINEVKNQKRLPNVGNSLMQQVAHISAVVGPHVTASAAEAAVTALCDENEIPKEIFDSEENGNELQLSTQGGGFEMDATSNESEKGVIPLPLRMRATSAVALGAAAAHAKLLAVQEEIEIERLVSSVINTQLKKLQYKLGLLNEAEVIMEKEYSQMVELEDSLITERMDVVEKVIDSGVSRWRDKTMAKPQEEIVL